MSRLHTLALGLSLALFAAPSPLIAADASPATIDPEIATAAQSLIDASLQSRDGYDALAVLCDEYGHRLSGTLRLERAIDWAAEQMLAFGLTNVHKEEVLVPVWVRGEESLTLLEPKIEAIPMLGLGRSVGTREGGIEAELIVVDDFEQFDARPDEDIAGKIVLFNAEYEGYGRTVGYRVHSASIAAERGALAVLVRSIGPRGHRTPHTGSLRYRDDAPQIPAAAISTEDADSFARLAARGQRIVLRLAMQAHTLEDRISHNLVGEIVGREKPEEIVVVGGHIDSWDVGQGAQDDGVGCMIALEAVHLMKRLELVPRRTVRVVFWTNEENGLRGAKAYQEAHADDHHVAAIESDTGNGLASGFRFDFRPSVLGLESAEQSEARFEQARAKSMAIAQTIASLLSTVEADTVFAAGSGADVGPLAAQGVVALGMHHDSSEYFRIHHTEADTFDRIILEDMQKNIAAMAVMAYALAEMETTLGAP